MKIELRKISHNTRLSEETHAYSADLFVDGAKVAEVSNHGHGGCDNVRWLSKDVKEADVEKWIGENNPPMFIHDGKPCLETLESVCANLVNDWLCLRDYKRQAAKKVCVVDGSNIVSWNFKRPVTQADVDQIKKQNPDYASKVFINGKSDDELMTIIREQRANEKANRGW